MAQGQGAALGTVHSPLVADPDASDIARYPTPHPRDIPSSYTIRHWPFAPPYLIPN